MTSCLYLDLVPAARGLEPADVVYHNAEIFNVFTCDWERSGIAIKNGIIVGIGESYKGKVERDLHGASVVPGLIDAHVHIESSLLTPNEYARVVSTHGTTTVIADPHEIANVVGAAGIEFMLASRNKVPVDICYMLPSCVPATPADIGGATLGADALLPFVGRDGVCGLGEMMNVPGVLEGDTCVGEKLHITGIRDGHAPLLSGKDLNAYVLAGLQSDHECTTREEAEEKLRRGMYIFIREGSTERNIAALIPLVTPANVSRCAFATDDCHADLIVRDGHIDRCIRRAIACGCPPELAIRMATLSAAERFGLTDRGAIAPGRRADLCILQDNQDFVVKETIFLGREIHNIPFSPQPGTLPSSFRCAVPTPDQIQIAGSGIARVIGLVPHQIITQDLRYEISAGQIPDTQRDIQKIVVCNRYRERSIGVGLVQGFGFSRGAIATSVAHDAHHCIATGTSDADIIRAITAVIRSRGAMAAVIDQEVVFLPLDCAGLMSTLPYPEVVSRLDSLHEITKRIGGIPDPFMYLSFLALTVIPSLRITDRGVFDGIAFRDVPLFESHHSR
jgi:adenine deaminase